MEQKRLIRISDDADLSAPSMPGNPLSLKAFKDWIADAESAATVSLTEAKQKWSAKLSS